MFGNRDYWRALILYGKNQSTYKMALGRCLINYSLKNQTKVSLDELADDFYQLYLEKVKAGKNQGALLGKKTYVEQEILNVVYNGKSKATALEVIKDKSLSSMVLQKFHTLNDKSIRIRFYQISDDSRYLLLTDDLLSIFGNDTVQDEFLTAEVSSRWDLLEHAFENIHKIEGLDVDAYLQYLVRRQRRTNITKVIPTLEGYQQGRCFYCGETLYDIEVDHVIPYKCVGHDQIWNLVLAHKFCNQNKSDNVAPIGYIHNLIQRNEFFIASAHPIKNTLIQQLGKTAKGRQETVFKAYQEAKRMIVRMWNGISNYEPMKDQFYRMVVRSLGSDIQ